METAIQWLIDSYIFIMSVFSGTIAILIYLELFVFPAEEKVEWREKK